MEPETKLWLTLANDDFQNTQLLWKNRRYGATVFFSQQAVEKILKAYIVEFRKTLPPKTHRIEILIQAAKLDLSEIDSPAVDALSKAYIRVRYPDLNKQYYTARTKVEPLVIVAERLYIWVKNKFKNH